MTDHAKALEVLEEIEGRAEKATLGPWYSDDAIEGLGSAVMSEAVGLRIAYLKMHNHEDTADFIAASRTDIPKLVKAVRAVLELHEPTHGEYNHPEWLCEECDGTYQPCSTVSAICEALGASDAE